MKSPKPRDASGDVRAERLARGLTQQELAARARCSIASIAMFEGGYRPARSSDVLARILKALNESSPTRKSGSIDDDHQGAEIARHDIAA